MDAPNEDLYLCLDQGGHASRAIVVDSRGQIRAEAFREIGTQRDGARVEHLPAEIVATLQSAAEQAVEDLGRDAERIVAAGFATQRSSLVCWHRQTGAALSPVISWQDTRAAEWLAEFVPHQERVHGITGLMLSPHYGVSKMNWCLTNLPAVRRARADGQLIIGPLAAFVVNQLLDSRPLLADPANASRTLLWDRKTCDWSVELLTLFDVPAECLPTCVPSRYDWGSLQLGGRSIPVTVVTGDQSAALFAFGEPVGDTVYANFGTGAFIQRSIASQNIDPGRLLASVVYQDQRNLTAVLEGTVNGAGSAINSICDQLGIDHAHMREHSARWLEESSKLPIFVNGVSGLGSPWWLSDINSDFVGSGSAEQKIAAVIESIAFMLTVNLQAMAAQAGPAGRMVATGGLAAVDPLLQRIASLGQLSVGRAELSEATTRGLAFLLAGLPADWPSENIISKFEPRPDTSVLARFDRWCAAMPPVPG